MPSGGIASVRLSACLLLGAVVACVTVAYRRRVPYMSNAGRKAARRGGRVPVGADANPSPSAAAHVERSGHVLVSSRFKCDGGRCVRDPSGPFAVPDCGQMCATNPIADAVRSADTVRYSCASGQCKVDPLGPFLVPTCNDFCDPTRGVPLAARPALLKQPPAPTSPPPSVPSPPALQLLPFTTEPAPGSAQPTAATPPPTPPPTSPPPAAAAPGDRPDGGQFRCVAGKCVKGPGPFSGPDCLELCDVIDGLGPDWTPPTPPALPDNAPSFAIAFSGHFRGLGQPLVHRAVKANLIDAFGGRSAVFMSLKFEELAWPMNTRDFDNIVSRPGVGHHNVFQKNKIRPGKLDLAKAVKWLGPAVVQSIPDDSPPPRGCSLYASRLWLQARGINIALQAVLNYEKHLGKPFDYWARLRPDLLWVRRFPSYSYFAKDPDPGPAYISHDTFEFARGSVGRNVFATRFDQTANPFGTCASGTHELVVSGHICTKCQKVKVAGCAYAKRSWMTHSSCNSVMQRCQQGWMFEPWPCMVPYAMMRELRPMNGEGPVMLTSEGYSGCAGVPICNLNFTAPADVDRQVAAWNRLEMCGRCMKVWLESRRQKGVPCYDVTSAEGGHPRDDATEKCEREEAGTWTGPLGCTLDRCDASRWHMFKPKNEWVRADDGRNFNHPGTG
eukprot:TRINITY_DN3076_c1_g2_i2.p1 TRINITY_DN3076_c1_g2~~TRINITY_DN3076_c1_g2_i2.p1  ORF type:complete len:670 (+),score=141.97 TRINITY_DN3076_c1_g2_i2:64-2073(+)